MYASIQLVILKTVNNVFCILNATNQASKTKTDTRKTTARTDDLVLPDIEVADSKLTTQERSSKAD